MMKGELMESLSTKLSLLLRRVQVESPYYQTLVEKNAMNMCILGVKREIKSNNFKFKIILNLKSPANML